MQQMCACNVAGILTLHSNRVSDMMCSCVCNVLFICATWLSMWMTWPTHACEWLIHMRQAVILHTHIRVHCISHDAMTRVHTCHVSYDLIHSVCVCMCCVRV